MILKLSLLDIIRCAEINPALTFDPTWDSISSNEFNRMKDFVDYVDNCLEFDGPAQSRNYVNLESSYEIHVGPVAYNRFKMIIPFKEHVELNGVGTYKEKVPVYRLPSFLAKPRPEIANTVYFVRETYGIIDNCTRLVIKE